jgi:DUF1680 family protein
MEPLPPASVRLEDPFWAPRQKALVEKTIPLLFERLEQAGNLTNFRLAIAGARDSYQGPVYMDSDLYKAVEAAALTLQWAPDAPWKSALDDIAALVEEAQWEDGYVNTWYSVHRDRERYTNLRDAHELYCMGHLIEAAVAHASVDPDSRWMRIARRVVAHLVNTFLIQGHPGYPGHPEVELALLAYAENTGDEAALELARAFLERRGSHYFAREHGTSESEYDGTYWLDRVPICQLENLEGHAVRALYLLSAATDLARLTNDETYKECSIRLWERVTSTRQYITGGFGSTHRNEGFTEDYDLPNRTAYQESCASIAFVFWCERLARLTGEAKYVIALQRTLYNAVAAGASVEGDRFFYDNPLESDGSHVRSEWFRCACCPPNYARALAQMGRWVCRKSAGALYLWIPLSCRISFEGLTLQVRSDYPWDGEIHVDREGGDVRLSVAAEDRFGEADWIPIAGPRSELPMSVRIVEAHPAVEHCRGQFAVVRGPIVFCAEEPPESGLVQSLTHAEPPEANATPAGDPPTLRIRSWHRKAGALYTSDATPAEPGEIHLIPYGLWGNRGPAAMRVWLPRH